MGLDSSATTNKRFLTINQTSLRQLTMRYRRDRAAVTRVGPPCSRHRCSVDMNEPCDRMFPMENDGML